ncbi:MAG: DUF4919 domain-containing protein [Rhizomicrobium sp.]|nr:DUF4919 domain-containing protein [Rhizomicrobium sp.]
MGFFVRVGLCVCLIAVAAAAEPASKTYEQWVAMAEAGDPATDFTALRKSYTASSKYDGYSSDYRDLRADIWKFAQAKDCKQLLALSQKALKGDYTLIEVHIHRKICLRSMGDAAGTQQEDFVISGLTRSLMGSGDGKSPQTAYVVMTMAEETMVDNFLELDQRQQALINKDGHNYDLIEGTNRDTGKPMAVYFNVDAMFGSLTKMLGGADGKDTGK